MYKGFNLKLHPNVKQKEQFAIMFDNDRFVWNQLLNMLNKRYENNKDLKMLSAFAMGYLMKPFVQEYPKLKKSDSTSLRVVCSNMNLAWIKFFKDKTKRVGKPKFHSRFNPRQSYTGKTVRENCRVISKYYIRLPKVGVIKTSPTTRIPGNGDIKEYTVILTAGGEYEVSLTVDTKEKVKPTVKGKKAVGIDVGLHDLAILSNGIRYKKFESPYLDKKVKFYQKQMSVRRHQASILVAQDKAKKVLQPRTLDSFTNWQRARKYKASVQAKIARQRKDYLQKITTELVRKYDVICIEDIKVQELQKSLKKDHHNNQLTRALANQSWYMFRSMLAYKCEWYGKTLIAVEGKDSSRICANCGKKNHQFDNLNEYQWLGVRKWTCPNCHKSVDRDINAAQTILRRGLTKLNKNKKNLF